MGEFFSKFMGGWVFGEGPPPSLSTGLAELRADSCIIRRCHQHHPPYCYQDISTSMHTIIRPFSTLSFHMVAHRILEWDGIDRLWRDSGVDQVVPENKE